MCIYGSHYYHSHVQWATFWGGWTERLHDAMCKYVFKLFVINIVAHVHLQRQLVIQHSLQFLLIL